MFELYRLHINQQKCLTDQHKALLAAIDEGDLTNVQTRIAQNRRLINVLDAYQRSVLIHALIGNRTDICLYLIEKFMAARNFAILRMPDAFGLLPLHYAVLGGNLTIVTKILEIDPSSIDAPRFVLHEHGFEPVQDETSFYFAMRLGHSSIARVLMGAGARRNLYDSYHRPLHGLTTDPELLALLPSPPDYRGSVSLAEVPEMEDRKPTPYDITQPLPEDTPCLEALHEANLPDWLIKDIQEGYEDLAQKASRRLV